MPFIRNYAGAMQILSQIGTGKCSGTCKSIWIRNIKYALKTATNPLKLNRTQRKAVAEKIKSVSGRNAVNNHSKTLKKYKIYSFRGRHTLQKVTREHKKVVDFAYISM